ncbi:Argininosuccinate synthase [Candidatus Xiphinematobacter sp. Idaho Grape]|uniref:argininosuccinate synthase n=1 Tax=Candidatus Xiphinematobacter sp. Idaho Grape TaxID=1704307 RepID=UPI00070699EC|nr:argininosuccinate synthase [Candidatus Xiphinematobacter sp. Idaho Grape]ALJ56609.1 Argininosuccinate synthase [Candidatus Xiphinematobacter sp. Idaho Grape]
MKIIVAYSGGLDTSIILKWLKQVYCAEVIAFCADIGQEEELKGLVEKATQTGASKCYVEDLRLEFARDYIFPVVQAGALYEWQYFLGTSIARPLIAKRMVEIALREKAQAVAHGATGKGNDQVRFELAVAALAPNLKVIAPWRDERFRNQFPGRAELIAYAKREEIPVTVSLERPYSTDRNLLHISYEGGILEDPWIDASADSNRNMFRLSTSPQDAPDYTETLELLFEKGNCIGLAYSGLQDILSFMGHEEKNDTTLNPLLVMRVLNRLGGKHGIGRVDMVENRFVGMKSRGVYETPGGAILHFAHRQIESLTMDREVMHLRDSLIPQYSTLIYNGFWFSPERKAIQALITESQTHVSGTVRLKLYKGNVITAGRKSALCLYNSRIATMESGGSDDAYNQSDADGFIRLHALRLRIASKVYGKDSHL